MSGLSAWILSTTLSVSILATAICAGILTTYLVIRSYRSYSLNATVSRVNAVMNRMLTEGEFVESKLTEYNKLLDARQKQGETISKREIAELMQSLVEFDRNLRDNKLEKDAALAALVESLPKNEQQPLRQIVEESAMSTARVVSKLVELTSAVQKFADLSKE